MCYVCVSENCSQSRWKLGSLKRPNHSWSENNISGLSRKKSTSLREGQKSHDKEITDGSGIRENLMSELGTVIHRGAQSLRKTGRRKGMVVKDMSIWDSESSVSSISELSECPGTEEHCCEQTISPTPPDFKTFTVGSLGTNLSDVMNGSVPNGTGYPIPRMAPSETPFSSLNTEDSGINMTEQLSGKWCSIPVPNGKS